MSGLINPETNMDTRKIKSIEKYLFFEFFIKTLIYMLINLTPDILSIKYPGN